MATFRDAIVVALTVRDACKRHVENGRPIDVIRFEPLVAQAMGFMASCLPCPDDVFKGIAKEIRAETACTEVEAFMQVLAMLDLSRPPAYSRWRHGGWYVNNVRYPGGAVGCVSNRYHDKRWRIVCDDRRVELNAPGDVTFSTRERAARGEQTLALEEWTARVRSSA